MAMCLVYPKERAYRFFNVHHVLKQSVALFRQVIDLCMVLSRLGA